MFVKTTSAKVFVAFLNSIEFQFSNEVRRASTCPSKTVETAGLVEPGDLWSTIESKSSSLPSGISSARVVDALKSEKNSPCPSVKTSDPENDRVEPAKGEPVAETLHFAGDREAVRRQSVERVLAGVLKLLRAG